MRFTGVYTSVPLPKYPAIRMCKSDALRVAEILLLVDFNRRSLTLNVYGTIFCGVLCARELSCGRRLWVRWGKYRRQPATER